MSARSGDQKPAQRGRPPRNVSNLDAEQLKRKRQTDRIAQRALRQRTKSRVASLEHDLATLRDSSAQRQLELEGHVASLQARLDDIARLACSEAPLPDSRRSASSHMHDSDPLIHSNLDPAHGTESEPLPESESEPENESQLAPAPEPTSAPEPVHGLEPEPELSLEPYTAHLRAVSGSGGDKSLPLPDWHQSPTNSSRDTVGRSPFFYPPTATSTSSHAIGTDQQRSYTDTGAQTQSVDHYSPQARHGTVAADHERVPIQTPSSYIPPDSDEPRPVVRVSSVTCPHLPPDTPLDTILHNFRSSCHSLLIDGSPMASVLGPDLPEVMAVLQPDLCSNIHPLSRMLADVMATFAHVGDAEKMAFMFLMHATMRWLISSSAEDYSRLPRWLRPTATQITVPHATWIDNIPWPSVRDALVENPERYPFHSFSEAYSHHVSVNWPYDTSDAIQLRGPKGDHSISPVFEKHIRRLSNWTVSRGFEQAFPEMIALILTKD